MNESLRKGTDVSHYKIVQTLGRGGMGEVYRARDSRLERDVALKILPPDLVKNEERLRRFIQEAKTASNLSHPNIVTIHEIGSSQVELSADESSQVHFISMELIDGQTLGQKIHAEKCDLKTLLGYLAQAAEGLAKAHVAGVIHRDLKPDNIMVTRDGYAKVLDFGLAKLTGDTSVSIDGNEMPTTVRENTREGVIMGTVGYMAPEQVQAGVVDQRADIFAFGCILYEASTREKPFAGDSQVDILHKILHNDPPSITERNPSAPMELRRIVKRCLAKDPERRYQSMKDLALELRDLVDEYETLTPGSGSIASMAAMAAIAPASAGRRVMIPLIALLLAGAAAAGWLFTRPKPAAPATRSFDQMSMKNLTMNGKTSQAVISPDGRLLLHEIREGGKQSVWIKQIATGSDVPIIPSSSDSRWGFMFSNDGNYVYYLTQNQTKTAANLFVMPALGGPGREVIKRVHGVPAVTEDGRQIAFVRFEPDGDGVTSQLMIAAADGSGERRIASLRGQESFGSERPAWSPDATSIAIATRSFKGGLHFLVNVVSADGKQIRSILKQPVFFINGLLWLSDGSIVMAAMAREGDPTQLWLVSVEDGSARRITNDLNYYGGISATSDGKSLVAINADRRRELVRVAPDTGDLVRLSAEGDTNVPDQFAVGPDGTVTWTSTASGNADIWSLLPSGDRRQLTTHPKADFGSRHSPVGNVIIFQTERSGPAEMWRMNSDGSDQRPILKITKDVTFYMSPDGKWMVYASDNALWRVSVEGGTPQRIPVQAQQVFGDPSYSPDGTLIAVAGRIVKDTPSRVLIIPAAGGKPVDEVLLHVGGNSIFRWTPDGKGITHIDPTGVAPNIVVQPLADKGKPVQVTRFTSGEPTDFHWSPDGKDLIVSRSILKSDAVLITNFQ